MSKDFQSRDVRVEGATGSGTGSALWTREQIEHVWDVFTEAGMALDRESMYHDEGADSAFCETHRRLLADALTRAGLVPESSVPDACVRDALRRISYFEPQSDESAEAMRQIARSSAAWQQVKCADCGREYRCEPCDDYYRRPGTPDGERTLTNGACEPCLLGFKGASDPFLPEAAGMNPSAPHPRPTCERPSAKAPSSKPFSSESDASDSSRDAASTHAPRSQT